MKADMTQVHVEIGRRQIPAANMRHAMFLWSLKTARDWARLGIILNETLDVVADSVVENINQTNK